MKSLFGAVLFMSSAAFAATSVHEFTLDALNGTPTPLANFKGKVMLVVNVASQCGYTYQYEGLQALYVKYKDQGLVVAGFPANNFGGQDRDLLEHAAGDQPFLFTCWTCPRQVASSHCHGSSVAFMSVPTIGRCATSAWSARAAGS